MGLCLRRLAVLLLCCWLLSLAATLLLLSDCCNLCDGCLCGFIAGELFGGGFGTKLCVSEAEESEVVR